MVVSLWCVSAIFTHFPTTTFSTPSSNLDIQALSFEPHPIRVSTPEGSAYHRLTHLSGGPRICFRKGDLTFGQKFKCSFSFPQVFGKAIHSILFEFSEILDSTTIRPYNC
ncbi:hypothetical protein CEXT_797961 [Caerostris extrusa]|uniref:Uncharacterized protein n=1 Tax=Caerostris extrusa TaxID=172846 RepID=A0AAV4V813_CAEEX|nr:hypothetical protein CEXT_797961 [Caerostris extrusa]